MYGKQGGQQIIKGIEVLRLIIDGYCNKCKYSKGVLSELDEKERIE